MLFGGKIVFKKNLIFIAARKCTKVKNMKMISMLLNKNKTINSVFGFALKVFFSAGPAIFALHWCILNLHDSIFYLSGFIVLSTQVISIAIVEYLFLKIDYLKLQIEEKKRNSESSK